MRIKKQGFASLTKAKHLKLSAKGGSKKVPKGVALLPAEERTVRARNAANARWGNNRQPEKAEAINSQEDGRLNENEAKDSSSSSDYNADAT